MYNKRMEWAGRGYAASYSGVMTFCSGSFGSRIRGDQRRDGSRARTPSSERDHAMPSASVAESPSSPHREDSLLDLVRPRTCTPRRSGPRRRNHALLRHHPSHAWRSSPADAGVTPRPRRSPPRDFLGLDRPLGEQLLALLGQVGQGDFGRSLVKDDKVSTIISGRILPSIDLLIYSVIVSLLLTIPLAVLSAVKRNRLPDQLIRLLGMVVFAMPSFWLGLMLILLFGLKLRLLPVSGYETGQIGQLDPCPAGTHGGPVPDTDADWDLAVESSRITRLEYVEAARARGFSEARVIGRHAMPDSLVPLITILSINIGS